LPFAPVSSRLRTCYLQEGSSLLTNDHAGRHGIASRHARQNGSVRDPQAINAVDLQSTVDHRRRIAAHSCGTALMPEGAKPVAKEALQFIGIASGRCDLPHRERSQRGGIADLASDIQAGYQILQVLWIAKIIASIRTGSSASGPVRWMVPRLLGRIPRTRDQESANGPSNAAFSGVTSGPRRA
jgi:hypothetical protein